MISCEEEGQIEAQRRIAACKDARLDVLDLTGLRLSTVPTEILQLGWLRSLKLGIDRNAPFDSRDYKGWARNTLTSLPPELPSALPQLQFLDLSSNSLGEAGTKSLKEFNSLIGLDISDNDIGDGGVRNLVQLGNLTTLILRSNGIRPSGAHELNRLKNLTKWLCSAAVL